MFKWLKRKSKLQLLEEKLTARILQLEIALKEVRNVGRRKSFKKNSKA